MTDTTIKNEGDVLGTGKKNADGSPVQELDRDGQKVGEIKNKEHVESHVTTEKNADGTPVKEITS
ncbi:MAG: hypothetical protein ACR2F8_03055 [Caulobacteraceae bacterium]